MKIGDYVRTNNGGIGKIIKCPFKSMYLDEIWGDIENTETIITNNVYKTSPNIIDLIEVGDYVNGFRITSVYDDDSDANENNLKHKKCLGKNIYDEDYEEYLIYEEDIKSIVTKEQFEQMEYKVGVDKE